MATEAATAGSIPLGDTESLVNRSMIKAWLSWSLVWLTLYPLVGLLVSIKFHSPGFLDTVPWLQFGRLRPVHVNGVIFGSFSTPFLGLLYYMVPRLCGRTMHKERWGWLVLYAWNTFLVVGTASLLMGYNLGFEADEFEWLPNIFRFSALAVVTYQVVVTVYNRVEPKVYVSLWYITAAVVWTLLNLVLGNIVLPRAGIFGVDSAAMHGLYLHFVVGLWLTPAGLAMIYYFLPLSTKSPLYSHKISIIGFWTLAFFYPFVGTHHYLLSPIPYWTQTIAIVTSMLLIIPVWSTIVNFFGTSLGRWGYIAGGNDGASYCSKFLILGAIFYWIGCFQGSTEALRRMQELTHFSDFVIAHSHFTVFGAMVVWAIGGMYYVWPKVTGRELWSWKLAAWHFWLTVFGTSVMLAGLSAAGFVQFSELELDANFVDTVAQLKPWWVARTLAGATMDVGILLMVINFVKTARAGRTIPREEYSSAPSPWHPKVTMAWYEKPQAVMIVAGVAFFLLAVYSQGVSLLREPATHVDAVYSAATGEVIRVGDYTPQELRGRKVYIREGCWYCHSQYIRPMENELWRWGPVSQMGEYAYDLPHLFGTRRIGPDLHRIGLKYSDGWHAAHHWNPRMIRPESIMPRFPWLYKTPAKKGEVPELNDDGKALVAYLQRLGTGIGDWREGFASTDQTTGISMNVGAEDRRHLLALGKFVYMRRCAGCHGKEGKGDGPAAAFFRTKPRNFTTGIFKFHSTPGADALPTDGDLYRTITHGLWGTAMMPWYTLPSEERVAVVQFIKTFSDRWKKEQVKAPIEVPSEPPVTMAGLTRGRKLYLNNCAICHGDDAKGDGPIAASLTDSWGNPLRPADITLAAGEPHGVKLGHNSVHEYQTMMTGIGGTPMPPFEGVLKPDEAWDVVHYEQSVRIKYHQLALINAGMDRSRLKEANRRLWSELSDAARRGDLEQAVVAMGPDTPLQLAGKQ